MVSKAFLVEPETAPASTDQRSYVIAHDACSACAQASFNVGDEAVLLSAGLETRRRLYIKNIGGGEIDSIYIGGPNVGQPDTYTLRAKEELWLQATATCEVYALSVEESTNVVRILELGGD